MRCYWCSGVTGTVKSVNQNSRTVTVEWEDICGEADLYEWCSCFNPNSWPDKAKNQALEIPMDMVFVPVPKQKLMNEMLGDLNNCLSTC